MPLMITAGSVCAGLLVLVGLAAGFSGCSGCRSEPSQSADSQGGKDAAAHGAEVSGGRQSTVASPDSDTDATDDSDQADSSDRQTPAGHSPESSIGATGNAAGAPSDALRDARKLQQESRKQAEAGNYGTAFLRARDAWEQVNRFPGHAECRSLAKALLAEMETLADRANRQHSEASTNSDQPLIVK